MDLQAWQPGQHGKAALYGTIDNPGLATWVVDEHGNPHHHEVMKDVGNFMAMDVDPTGGLSLLFGDPTSPDEAAKLDPRLHTKDRGPMADDEWRFSAQQSAPTDMDNWEPGTHGKGFVLNDGTPVTWTLDDPYAPVYDDIPEAQGPHHSEYAEQIGLGSNPEGYQEFDVGDESVGGWHTPVYIKPSGEVGTLDHWPGAEDQGLEPFLNLGLKAPQLEKGEWHFASHQYNRMIKLKDGRVVSEYDGRDHWDLIKDHGLSIDDIDAFGIHDHPYGHPEQAEPIWIEPQQWQNDTGWNFSKVAYAGPQDPDVCQHCGSTALSPPKVMGYKTYRTCMNCGRSQLTGQPRPIETDTIHDWNFRGENEPDSIQFGNDTSALAKIGGFEDKPESNSIYNSEYAEWVKRHVQEGYSPQRSLGVDGARGKYLITPEGLRYEWHTDEEHGDPHHDEVSRALGMGRNNESHGWIRGYLPEEPKDEWRFAAVNHQLNWDGKSNGGLWVVLPNGEVHTWNGHNVMDGPEMHHFHYLKSIGVLDPEWDWSDKAPEGKSATDYQNMPVMDLGGFGMHNHRLWAKKFDGDPAAQKLVLEHYPEFKPESDEWHFAGLFRSPIALPTSQELAQGKECYFHPGLPAVAAEGFAPMCQDCYQRWLNHSQRTADKWNLPALEDEPKGLGDWEWEQRPEDFREGETNALHQAGQHNNRGVEEAQASSARSRIGVVQMGQRNDQGRHEPRRADRNALASQDWDFKLAAEGDRLLKLVDGTILDQQGQSMASHDELARWHHIDDPMLIEDRGWMRGGKPEWSKQPRGYDNTTWSFGSSVSGDGAARSEGWAKGIKLKDGRWIEWPTARYDDSDQSHAKKMQEHGIDFDQVEYLAERAPGQDWANWEQDEAGPGKDYWHFGKQGETDGLRADAQSQGPRQARRDSAQVQGVREDLAAEARGSSQQDTEQGWTLSKLTAMTPGHYTGDPGVDRLIDEFKFEEWHNWMRGRKRPTQVAEMDKPNEAYNVCNVISWYFADFMAKHGYEVGKQWIDASDIYPDWTNAAGKEKFGLKHMVNTITTRSGNYYVDWSAAQYGVDAVPKVTPATQPAQQTSKLPYEVDTPPEPTFSHAASLSDLSHPSLSDHPKQNPSQASPSLELAGFLSTLSASQSHEDIQHEESSVSSLRTWDKGLETLSSLEGIDDDTFRASVHESLSSSQFKQDEQHRNPESSPLRHNEWAIPMNEESGPDSMGSRAKAGRHDSSPKPANVAGMFTSEDVPLATPSVLLAHHDLVNTTQQAALAHAWTPVKAYADNRPSFKRMVSDYDLREVFGRSDEGWSKLYHNRGPRGIRTADDGPAVVDMRNGVAPEDFPGRNPLIATRDRIFIGRDGEDHGVLYNRIARQVEGQTDYARGYYMNHGSRDAGYGYNPGEWEWFDMGGGHLTPAHDQAVESHMREQGLEPRNTSGEWHFGNRGPATSASNGGRPINLERGQTVEHAPDRITDHKHNSEEKTDFHLDIQNAETGDGERQQVTTKAIPRWGLGQVSDVDDQEQQGSDQQESHLVRDSQAGSRRDWNFLDLEDAGAEQETIGRGHEIGTRPRDMAGVDSVLQDGALVLFRRDIKSHAGIGEFDNIRGHASNIADARVGVKRPQDGWRFAASRLSLSPLSKTILSDRRPDEADVNGQNGGHQTSMGLTEPWILGFQGKGYVDLNNKVHIWNSDSYNAPHHPDVVNLLEPQYAKEHRFWEVNDIGSRTFEIGEDGQIHPSMWTGSVPHADQIVKAFPQLNSQPSNKWMFSKLAMDIQETAEPYGGENDIFAGRHPVIWRPSNDRFRDEWYHDRLEPVSDMLYIGKPGQTHNAVERELGYLRGQNYCGAYENGRFNWLDWGEPHGSDEVIGHLRQRWPEMEYEPPNDNHRFASTPVEWGGNPESADRQLDGEHPVIYDGQKLVIGHEGLHHADAYPNWPSESKTGLIIPRQNRITWFERPDNAEELNQLAAKHMGLPLREIDHDNWSFAKTGALNLEEGEIPEGFNGKALALKDGRLIRWDNLYDDEEPNGHLDALRQLGLNPEHAKGYYAVEDGKLDDMAPYSYNYNWYDKTWNLASTRTAESTEDFKDRLKGMLPEPDPHYKLPNDPVSPEEIKPWSPEGQYGKFVGYGDEWHFAKSNPYYDPDFDDELDEDEFDRQIKDKLVNPPDDDTIRAMVEKSWEPGTDGKAVELSDGSTLSWTPDEHGSPHHDDVLRVFRWHPEGCKYLYIEPDGNVYDTNDVGASGVWNF